MGHEESGYDAPLEGDVEYSANLDEIEEEHEPPECSPPQCIRRLG